MYFSEDEPILFNGELITADQTRISIHDRSFNYGDGLFETMVCTSGRIRFFKEHFQRLTSGMERMKIHVPEHFEQMEDRLMNWLEPDSSCILRWQVWRSGKGKYTPLSSESHDLVRRSGESIETYPVHLGVSRSSSVWPHALSAWKTCNAMPYVLAGMERKETEYDDLILLDPEELVAEAIASNIFWVINGIYFTPRLTSGCVNGIMRQQVLKHLGEVSEVGAEVDILKEADHVFLSNARGFYPVTHIQGQAIKNQELPEGLLGIL